MTKMLVLAVFLGSHMGIAAETDNSGPTGAADVNPTTTNFNIRYTEARTDGTNITRRTMAISATGDWFTEEDCKSRHRRSHSRGRVDPAIVEALQSAILAAGILELPASVSDQAKVSAPGADVRLTVTLAGLSKDIRVHDAMVPPELARVRDLIQNICGPPILSPSPRSDRELAELSRAEFQEAKAIAARERSGADREILVHLKSAIWYLEIVEPKPAFYEDVLRMLEQYSKQQPAEPQSEP